MAPQMSPGMGGFLGGLLSGIGNIVGSGIQTRAAKKAWQADVTMNMLNMQEQRRVNALQMQREDNAVQRRASDLTSAGLSKTLAAGSPAVAGRIEAPVNEAAPSPEAAGSAMGEGVRGLGNVLISALEAKNLMQSIIQQGAAIGKTQAEKERIALEAEGQKIENAQKQWNLDWYKTRKLPLGWSFTPGQKDLEQKRAFFLNLPGQWRELINSPTGQAAVQLFHKFKNYIYDSRTLEARKDLENSGFNKEAFEKSLIKYGYGGN